MLLESIRQEAHLVTNFLQTVPELHLRLLGCTRLTPVRGVLHIGAPTTSQGVVTGQHGAPGDAEIPPPGRRNTPPWQLVLLYGKLACIS
jgi:hypothetical protein